MTLVAEEERGVPRMGAFVMGVDGGEEAVTITK
jgi:hypothetical protein